MYATRRTAAVWGIVLSTWTACGTGSAPPAPTAAAHAAAVAPGAVAIYDDGLSAGWGDWSWGSTRNLAATSPVASGTRSLAVTFQAWGGLYFRRSGASTAGTSTLQLSVNGGAAGGNQLLLWAVQGSTNLASVKLASYCAGGTIPANAWTRCQVPLSALAPAGSVLDGFVFQEVDGAARPTMYFDEVVLLPAAPAPPTNLVATASASGVALAWAGSTGATGYDVWRATASAGPFTRLTASAQAAVAYSDAAVAAGSTYWYQVTAANAAGSSGPSVVVPATVPATVPAASLAIYADGLSAGWGDWSWGSTRNFAATSPVASGTRSLAVTFQAWGGLYFRRSGASTAGTSTLQLSVNGGAAGGNQLLLWAVQGSTNLASVKLASYCAGGTIPANAWTRCQVPLSTLAPAGSVLDGLVFQEVDGAARPTMYFDDIALTGGQATSPPPVVTVAISPLNATVDACGTTRFGATVSGVTDGSVGWSVQEGTAGGTVDGSGAYTAPSTAGTYHLIATSKASPSASASAPVVVQDRILSVAVVPGSATVAPGGKLQLAATVTTSCGSFVAVQ